MSFVKQDDPSLTSDTAALLAKAEQMAHLGSWQIDVTTGRAIWSKELFRIFNLKPSEFGPNIEEYRKFIHHDDLYRLGRIMEELIATGKLNDKVSMDYRIVLPDSSVRILHSERAVTEVTDEGKPKIIVGIEQDITEHKKAEQALQESESRFRLVAEAAKVMVYETDVRTAKATIYRGAEELVGYKPDEIDFTVDWVLNRIHPEDVLKVANFYKAAVKKSKRTTYAIKYRFKHKNGKYIIVQDTARALRDTTGKTVRLIGGIYDISQRERDRTKIEKYSKHLERLVSERTKLLNSERFVTIGQTAGMVGHDLRNPLQTINGEIYLAKAELDALPEGEQKTSLKESLEAIAEQTIYMDKIVSDLQAFVQPVTVEKETIHLRRFFTGLLSQLNIPINIKTQIQIGENLAVMADPQLLRRVFINLMNNAVQAMPDGGNLTVKAEVTNQSKIQITIEDTGVGIPDKLKSKIFLPLFTTKAKGQGFGLAVCKRVIEAQGGTIAFQSHLGKGTKFTVSLPSKADLHV